jgi:hypothetical protein
MFLLDNILKVSKCIEEHALEDPCFELLRLINLLLGKIRRSGLISF